MGITDTLQEVAGEALGKGSIHHATLTSSGYSALWTVFTIFGLASLAFTGLALTKPIAKREHFYVTIAVTLTAGISYFAMATGRGHIEIPFATGDVRDVYYARYIDWLITTPLLLVDVLLIAKLPLASCFFAIFADIAMVITGLFGGLYVTEYRWGWYIVACLFMAAIFVILYQDGTKYVEARDSSMSGFYQTVVLSLVVLWTCYPVVWAFAEGTGALSANAEAYLYAILDVVAKVGFGAFILVNDEKLQTSYGKSSGDGTEPLLQA